MDKKIITVTFEGKEYTLEYNRRAAERLEEMGFSPANTEDIQNLPLNSLWKLFRCAFYMHHKAISEATIEKIYDACPNKMGILPKLVEMYGDCLNSLLGENTDEGNSTWGANW